MATLYILGNGFDLAHHLPVSYYGFESFLKLNDNESLRDIASKLEGVYKPELLWGDFEHSLGNPNMGVVNYVENAYRLPIFDHDFFKEVVKAFEAWIRKVNSFELSRISKDWFAPKSDDVFISFNYTSVLESVYRIEDKNIVHIHGFVAKSYFRQGEFVIGHNEIVTEQSHEILKITKKDTSSVINRYKTKIAKLLAQIETIVVVGLSYSDIDLPYFEYIRTIKPKVHWEFGVFSGSDFANLQRYIKALALNKNEYKIFSTKEEK